MIETSCGGGGYYLRYAQDSHSDIAQRMACISAAYSGAEFLIKFVFHPRSNTPTILADSPSSALEVWRGTILHKNPAACISFNCKDFMVGVADSYSLSVSNKIKDLRRLSIRDTPKDTPFDFLDTS